MKELIGSHTRHIYLKPGELVIAKKPSLVTTLLGSCVAVTLFSPSSGIGAICHAMLPKAVLNAVDDLRYVDTALELIYERMKEYGALRDCVVKLFGGANMFGYDDADGRMSVGRKNIESAKEKLATLNLKISSEDLGGFCGRKLLFCTRDGDVFLRRFSKTSQIRERDNIWAE